MKTVLHRLQHALTALVDRGVRSTRLKSADSSFSRASDVKPLMNKPLADVPARRWRCASAAGRYG